LFRQLDILTPAGSASRREGARSHRAHLAVAGVAAGALGLVVMLVGAAPAQAKLPIVGEIPVVGEAVEGIGSVGEAVLNPAEAVLKGFVHLLQAIFGGFEAHLITEVISGLLAIPNFDTGHVAGLEQDGFERLEFNHHVTASLAGRRHVKEVIWRRVAAGSNVMPT